MKTSLVVINAPCGLGVSAHAVSSCFGGVRLAVLRATFPIDEGKLPCSYRMVSSADRIFMKFFLIFSHLLSFLYYP
jgi:hypothetical protein